METILYTKADGVATLTLNRPEVMNAINFTLIDEMRAAVAECAKDPEVGALLLTANGRGFCAGADLAAKTPTKEGLSRGGNVAYGMEVGFNPLVQELHDLPKPVVSAVNGTAAGGGVGLALCADIVIAGKSASFIQVFGPKLALIPDMGCTWFVPRLIGLARAKALAMTGEKLTATTAAEWGMIWKCVEDDVLQEEALGLAKQLANGPANAFAEISTALEISNDHTLAQQLEYERNVQGKLGDHDNFTEGVTAFLQKRPAKFKR